MTEVIGDLVMPSELIIPTPVDVTNPPTLSGALYMSGAKLAFFDGTNEALVTSV